MSHKVFTDGTTITGLGTINNPLASVVGGTTDWTVLGNTGTNSSINFVGTLDNVDLMFRRNNVRIGRFGQSNTSLGVNAGSDTNSSQYVAIGNSALGLGIGGCVAIGNNAGAFVTGQNNTFIGDQAGRSDVVNTGGNNIALGYSCASGGIQGNLNTLVGPFISGTQGANNVGIGYIALGGLNNYFPSNLCINNVTLGNESSRGIISASNNISIGHQSFYYNTESSNNVVLGRSALFADHNDQTNYADISTGWTTVGWTSGADNFTWNHTTGNTSVLSFYLNIFHRYRWWSFTLSITNRTAGSITVANAGSTVSSTHSTNTTISNTNVRLTRDYVGSGTDPLAITITPTSDFNGTISLIARQFRSTSITNSIAIGANTVGKIAQEINSITIGNTAISRGSNTTTIGNSSTTSSKLFGRLNIGTVPEHADNAAALLASLVAGDVYRTGDNLKVVH